MFEKLKKLWGESQERLKEKQKYDCFMIMVKNIEAMGRGEPCSHNTPLGFKLAVELKNLEKIFGTPRESVIQMLKESEMWSAAKDAEKEYAEKVFEYMLADFTRA